MLDSLTLPSTLACASSAQGTTDKKGGECATCKGKLIDCAGHFGYIKLEMPVFHIGYFKNIIGILQCICKSCAHVLLSEEDRAQYLKRFRNPRLEIVPRQGDCSPGVLVTPPSPAASCPLPTPSLKSHPR